MPGAGGLLDQDPYWVSAFSLWFNLQGTKQQLEEKRGESRANRMRSKRGV